MSSTKESTGGKTQDTKFDFGKKGWRLVIVGLLAYTFYIGFENILNYVVPIYSEQFQVSATSLMLYTSIGGWLSVIAIVIFGAIQKKIGCKKNLILCLLIVIFAGCIWANAVNVTMYALGAILTKALGTVICLLIFAELGANWFPTKKGNYMGVVTVGVVLGAFVANGPIGSIVKDAGVQKGLMILVFLAVIVLALSLAFVKNFPEEAGANPDNDKDMTPEQAKAILETVKEYQRSSKWTVSVCLKNKTVWLVGLSFGLLLCVAQGMMAQVVPAAISFGHSSEVAQIMSVLMAPAALIATLVTGKMDQRHGTKKVAVVIFALGIVACMMGGFVGRILPILFLAFVLVVVASSGGNNLLMSFTGTIWGRVDFSTPYMVALTISQVISAFGYVLTSGLASVGETFEPAFLGGAVTIILGIICVLAVSDKFLGRTKEEIVQNALK